MHVLFLVVKLSIAATSKSAALFFAPFFWANKRRRQSCTSKERKCMVPKKGNDEGTSVSWLMKLRNVLKRLPLLSYSPVELPCPISFFPKKHS